MRSKECDLINQPLEQVILRVRRQAGREVGEQAAKDALQGCFDAEAIDYETNLYMTFTPVGDARICPADFLVQYRERYTEQHALGMIHAIVSLCVTRTIRDLS
jgi:hypothetical protein